MEIFKQSNEIKFDLNSKTAILGPARTGKTYRIMSFLNNVNQSIPLVYLVTKFHLRQIQENIGLSKDLTLLLENNDTLIFANSAAKENLAFVDLNNLAAIFESLKDDNTFVVLDECNLFPVVLQFIIQNNLNCIVTSQHPMDIFVSIGYNGFDYFDIVFLGKPFFHTSLIGDGGLFKDTDEYTYVSSLLNQGKYNFAKFNLKEKNIMKTEQNEISQTFIDLMNSELDRNSFKGDWKEWKPSNQELISRMMYEISLLNQAVSNDDSKAIAIRTAALANFSEKMFMNFYMASELQKQNNVNDTKTEETLNTSEQDQFGINAIAADLQEGFKFAEKVISQIISNAQPIAKDVGEKVCPIIKDFVEKGMTTIFGPNIQDVEKKQEPEVQKSVEPKERPLNEVQIESLIDFASQLKKDGYSFENFTGLLEIIIKECVELSEKSFDFDNVEFGELHKEHIKQGLSVAKYVVFAKMRNDGVMKDFVGYLAKNEVDLLEALVDAKDKSYKVYAIFSKLN